MVLIALSVRDDQGKEGEAKPSGAWKQETTRALTCNNVIEINETVPRLFTRHLETRLKPTLSMSAPALLSSHALV